MTDARPRPGRPRRGSGLASQLADLIFPLHRPWLFSTLWDEADTCIGGPCSLTDALVRDPKVNARRVQPGEDLHLPGCLR